MKSRFLILCALLATAVVSPAAQPSGSYSYTFSTNNVPLWDLTGVVPLEQSISGTAGVGVPVQVSVLVDQDRRGRVRGFGTTSALIATNTVNGEYSVKGRVWTSEELVRVKLNLKLSGRGEISGQMTDFRISAVHHFELDATTLQLVGDVRGSARFSQLENGPIRGDSLSPLAAGNDGSWTLNVEVVPAKKLGGSAAATLVNSRTFLFEVKGKYSESSDSSRLKLNGYGTGKRINLKLLTSGSEMELEEIKGKALGQNMKYAGGLPE